MTTMAGALPEDQNLVRPGCMDRAHFEPMDAMVGSMTTFRLFEAAPIGMQTQNVTLDHNAIDSATAAGPDLRVEAS